MFPPDAGLVIIPRLGFVRLRTGDNPGLSGIGGLTAFSHVLTESNTTHKSVPMLLSPVSASSFDSIYYQKGIITAFKEAGNQTAFFSNQRYNHSFIDFFGKEADTYDFIKEDVGDSNYNPSDNRKVPVKHAERDAGCHRKYHLHGLKCISGQN